MEFRYGYCYMEKGAETEEEIETCFRATFAKSYVNERIDSTSISCWTLDLSDNEDRMWREHGSCGPAIRIAVDSESFLEHVKTHLNPPVPAGPVTYEGALSLSRPQFLNLDRPGRDDLDNHLFFHKRGAFEWEKEYRIIVGAPAAVRVSLNPDLIRAVAISPLGALESTVESSLRAMFADRVE